MSTRLFIGNIPSGTQEDDLKKEFEFYGKVVKVDLKEKNDLNDSQTTNKLFAFITLESNTLNVNKCIQEFSEQKWNGSFLKVSIAKESFLERLKRERSEAGSPKEIKVEESQLQIPKYDVETKRNYNSYDAHFEKGNDHQNEKEKRKDSFNNMNISTDDIVVAPKKNYYSYDDHLEKGDDHQKKKEKRKDSFNNMNISTDDIVVEPKKSYYSYDDHLEKGDDHQKKKEKRKDSFNNMNISTDDIVVAPKKIKIWKSIDPNVSSKTTTNGFSNVAHSNKIEKEKGSLNPSDKKRLESIQNMKSVYNEKKSLIKMALSGVDTKKNNKIIFNDDEDGNVVSNENTRDNKCAERVSNVKSNKSKAKLFVDESDDGDDTYNFELKQQFEGESGRKLLELQSRYQSDKRFVLDERFLDVDDKNDLEMENNDEIDAINDDEKLKQFQILQGIVGDSKVISIRTENANSKKLPLKTMLRFDPSRPDHTKFLNKPSEKSAVSKKSKKENKINEKERPAINAAPEVSHERYYKINEFYNISQAQSTDTQPFSITSLFKNNNIEDIETPGEEYSTKPIEKSNKKVKNPLGGEKNPFFYDTSDSEDESSKKEKTKDSKKANPPLNGDSTVKSTAIIENFFFSDKDARLMEGLEFFLNTKPSTEKLRRELKSVVKKRIQNNKRNSKYQPKKVSHHSKPRRFKKR
ncbi:putative RNA-binding protein CG14230 [Arctopsyche grandis]|uniref:putative RNA-binding protein CG14230 n=1 Tax=Arctopsyche grandis TaxID=121162 RepID=UPI00406D78A8